MKITFRIIAIITLAILVSLNGICQLPTIRATTQGWAGGICCRSGTNYQVILTGKKETLDNFKAGSVCIGGLQFESEQINVSTTTVDNKTVVYLNMSISHDEADMRPDLIIDKSAKQTSCSTMQVNYSTGWKHHTIIIEKVEELEFLAYP
jgi:hypothetical protein